MVGVRKLFKRSSKKSGLPPGTVVHVGEKKLDKVQITVMDYDERGLEEKVIEKVEDCFAFSEKPTVTWINVDGVHEPDIIKKIGAHFNLHSLTLEDIAHTSQRPKLEFFDNYIFIILRMITFDEKENEIKTEQIGLVLGENYVISFQETIGDIFDNIRERIRSKKKTRIKKMGPDYLVYSLMDAIVDNYFLILEKLGEKIEDMEEAIIKEPKTVLLHSLYQLKREMVYLRKSVWPLREVIARMEKDESPLIQKTTYIYLRDIYDHTIQVIDAVETARDTLSGMIEIYLSSISNRMNEVMKVLTVIATLFIPLTFIVGIYGMNFRHMPELEWQWSYPILMVAMFLTALVMLFYFHKKGWI